jgi:cytochrome c-type biogenesis protein CcmH
MTIRRKVILLQPPESRNCAHNPATMTLWFGFALMTAAAVFAVLWPLARRGRDLRSGSDVAVYRDQLDEIERDRAAGRIAENEAAAAQVEVSRRLLAAADAPVPVPNPAASAWRRRAVAVVALVLLPAGAAAAYLALGSPALPDQPLAARLDPAKRDQAIEVLIARVEAHLESNPEDGRGWEVVAPVYLRLGRFEDAVRARRNALRLNGETAERVAALGEALVGAAQGIVTAEAKELFERAVALDRNEMTARYFLGLAAEQDGRREEAASIWRAMLEGAPADARWVEFVRRELARLEGAAAPGGPSEQEIAAASDLSPEQRSVMIRTMVARLAERLHRDGSDIEGWIRLVRSYVVLGEREQAKIAIADARRALANDPAKLRRLDEFAKGLGLEG